MLFVLVFYKKKLKEIDDRLHKIKSKIYQIQSKDIPTKKELEELVNNIRLKGDQIIARR